MALVLCSQNRAVGSACHLNIHSIKDNYLFYNKKKKSGNFADEQTIKFGVIKLRDSRFATLRLRARGGGRHWPGKAKPLRCWPPSTGGEPRPDRNSAKLKSRSITNGIQPAI
jgi:hypothetical protein